MPKEVPVWKTIAAPRVPLFELELRTCFSGSNLFGNPVGHPSGNLARLVENQAGFPAECPAGNPAGFPAGNPAGFPAEFLAVNPAGCLVGNPAGFPARFLARFPGRNPNVIFGI